MEESCLLFPEPLGRYAVGTKIFHLIDKNRQELYSCNKEDFSSLNPAHHRELMIKLYYPTKGEKKPFKVDFPVMPYWEKFLATEIQRGQVTSKILSDVERIYTYSRPNVPLHPSSSFPLIIFCPGMIAVLMHTQHFVKA
ncbi:MAG: hypothetical protein K0M45_03470 [Candidatus Paracaedibacteraceae bacterium]|nr:hypothetical protein [Candidatus Paracaedibacteraceae bacterium]